MSNLGEVSTGDVVVRGGQEWTVIGFSRQPVVLLARKGCEHLPIEVRTHVSVDPESNFALEWQPKDQSQ